MSTHTFLVFASREVADVVTFDIAATPDIEQGIGPVWVFYHPDTPKEGNTVSYAEAADKVRVAMAHPWSEIDREWLSIYCDEWIAKGLMWVLDHMPADWYPPVKPPPEGEAVSGEITFRFTLE